MVITKNLFNLWFYTHLSYDLKNVYSRMSGAVNPRGQSFYVNRNLLSLRSFVASLKKNLFKVWFYTIFFHDFIHVYSPGAGADSPQGTKFWCQQKCLITSFICSKFQKNIFEVWFYTFFSWFNTYIYPLGRGRQPPGDKILMSTERPYHFTHLLQVSKKSLWNLILYNFFHDLIHVYSPEAGSIQPPRDKVLMSTETSCLCS